VFSDTPSPPTSAPLHTANASTDPGSRATPFNSSRTFPRFIADNIPYLDLRDYLLLPNPREIQYADNVLFKDLPPSVAQYLQAHFLCSTNITLAVVDG